MDYQRDQNLMNGTLICLLLLIASCVFAKLTGFIIAWVFVCFLFIVLIALCVGMIKSINEFEEAERAEEEATAAEGKNNSF
jgi:hypothetical protein